jgi:hypothetical protein
MCHSYMYDHEVHPDMEIDQDIAENAIDDTRTRPGLPRVLFELTSKFRTIPCSGKLWRRF